MTKVCHECGENLYNPFYQVSLILIDELSGKTAYSDLHTTICRRHYKSVSGQLKTNPSELDSDFGLAIDSATGFLGGVTGAVQTSSGIEAHNLFKYLDLSTGRIMLPRSIDSLVISPEWAEYINDDWRMADWAKAIYDKIRAN